MKKRLVELFEVRQLTFYIFVLLAFSLAWNTGKVIQRNHGLQQQVDRLKDEVALLELKNENLRLGIEYYKTDSYLELEARRKFNKAAAGESVLLLPKDTTPEVQTEQTAQLTDRGSNWQQWMYFLFGSEQL